MATSLTSTTLKGAILTQKTNKITQKPAVTTTRGILCRANIKNKEILTPALLTTIPTILAANPALAEVGRRMNGDGTALPLGINEPVLLFCVLLTFGGVWAFYASAAKNFGGGENEDSGLSL